MELEQLYVDIDRSRKRQPSLAAKTRRLGQFNPRKWSGRGLPSDQWPKVSVGYGSGLRFAETQVLSQPTSYIEEIGPEIRSISEMIGRSINQELAQRIEIEQRDTKIQELERRERFAVRMNEHREALFEIANLPAEWSGRGAKKVSAAAVAFSAMLFSDLERRSHRRDSDAFEPVIVAPLANGGIQLEWELDSILIEIEVGPVDSYRVLVFKDRLLQNDIGVDFENGTRTALTWICSLPTLAKE